MHFAALDAFLRQLYGNRTAESTRASSDECSVERYFHDVDPRTSELRFGQSCPPAVEFATLRGRHSAIQQLLMTVARSNSRKPDISPVTSGLSIITGATHAITPRANWSLCALPSTAHRAICSQLAVARFQG